MDASLQWDRLDEAFAKAWLLSIARDLEIGVIEHAEPAPGHCTVDWLEANGVPRGHYFNMAAAISHSDDKECGTCACIGGWLAMKLGITEPDEVDTWVGEAPERWERLFYPSEAVDWSSITPKQAVKAIKAFVAGRDNPWEGLV